MIGNATTKLGVVLVVAGALLMAGPIFGFSTLAADRGVNVGTADDPNALLGIIDNSGAESADIHPSTGQEGDVFFLNDNSGHFSAEDLSATVLAFNGASTALTATVEPAGGDNDLVVRVRCGDSNLNDAGELTVQLTAESTVSLELERTTTNQIDVQCSGGGPPSDPGPGFASYAANDVIGPNPASQELTFTLDNKLSNGGQVDIDITSFYANYEESEIETFTVGGESSNDNVEFQRSGTSGTVTVTAQGKIGAGQEIRIVLDGIEIEDAYFGLAWFSTDSVTESDWFTIDSGSLSTADTKSSDTITREELESIPIDELERFDTYDELEAHIESETDIDVVEE